MRKSIAGENHVYIFSDSLTLMATTMSTQVLFTDDINFIYRVQITSTTQQGNSLRLLQPIRATSPSITISINHYYSRLAGDEAKAESSEATPSRANVTDTVAGRRAF